MFSFLMLQQDPDPFRLMREVLESPLLHTALLGLVLVVAALWLALTANAYLDATRRGTFPAFWALACFLLPFLGYLIYLIVRPAEYSVDREERELRVDVLRQERRALRESRQAGTPEPSCHSCGDDVREDYAVCPSCGDRLKEPCRGCDRPLDLTWHFCPYCGADPSGVVAARGADEHRRGVPPAVPLEERRIAQFGVQNRAARRGAPLRDVVREQ